MFYLPVISSKVDQDLTLFSLFTKTRTFREISHLSYFLRFFKNTTPFQITFDLPRDTSTHLLGTILLRISQWFCFEFHKNRQFFCWTKKLKKSAQLWKSACLKTGIFASRNFTIDVEFNGNWSYSVVSDSNT